MESWDPLRDSSFRVLDLTAASTDLSFLADFYSGGSLSSIRSSSWFLGVIYSGSFMLIVDPGSPTSAYSRVTDRFAFSDGWSTL